METQNIDKYIKAQKQLKAIKGFYSEVLIFLLSTFLIFFFKESIISLFGSVGHNANFIKWLNWNIMLLPVWWGIVLLIKAKCIFKFKFGFIKKWEERQIKKYMK